MNKQTEALRLALEALAASDDFLFNYHDCEPNNEREVDAYSEIRANNMAAWEAVREALTEQPAQQHEQDRQMDQLIQERDHRDEIIDKLCDAVLGLDRYEWSSQYFFEDAVREVEERMAAFEQPAQEHEPVVWMYVNKSTHETKFQKHMRDFVDHGLWSEVPLYGEPLANHELQCVCGAVWLGDEMVHLPNKRPPASKPWVGLTDEERATFDRWVDNSMVGTTRAIEAKLREKNA